MSSNTRGRGVATSVPDRADDELRYQQAVAACARVLLGSDAGRPLGDALDALLAASNATTLFVVENFEHPELGLCSRLLHEALKPGIVVDHDDWRIVPWSRLPESRAALERGEAFIYRAGEFRSVEKEMRSRTSVKSGAQLPIFVDGGWAGLVGFSDHESGRSWAGHDIRLLEAAAEMFGRLWERDAHQQLLQESMSRLRERLEYERVLAICSQALLVGSDRHALEKALDALVMATGARFAAVAVNVDHPELGPCSQAVARSEVRAAGAAPVHEFDDYWYFVPWSRQPELYEALSRGVPSAHRIPDFGPIGRDMYEGSPVATGSIVGIPIMMGGEWRGSLVYGHPDPDHRYVPEGTALFQTAADMIGAFLVRQEAQRHLENLLSSKDEFVAAVSHELRTPLTTVVGLSEELRDRGAEISQQEQAEFSAMIAEQALEMASIVDDLLVVARSDDTTIELDLASLDMRQEVARVVRALGPGRDIEVSAEPDCRAKADGTRVRQVVRNLMTNAIRYGGPNVRVDCSRRDDLVTVAVSDDGAEIEASARERIFEPYERAHEEPTQPASVGLGLTVARRLANQMGGDLTYRRCAGRNVFELSLPAG